MSLFSTLFGPAPDTSKPQATPPVNPPPGATLPNGSNPTNLGTQVTSQTAPNGVVPEKKEESPLDKFNDIWKNAPVAPGNESVFGEIDPQKLMEAAGKVDFKQVISQDALAKIAAGGQEGVTAFADSLNKVAQTVFGQNAVATTKIVEQALAKQRESFQTQLPGLIRKHGISDSLRTENPLLSNPAVAPIVEALQTQFAAKNPLATEAEIKASVVEYMSGLGAVFAPKAQESGNTGGPKAAKQTDWSLFLNS